MLLSLTHLSFDTYDTYLHLSTHPLFRLFLFLSCHPLLGIMRYLSPYEQIFANAFVACAWSSYWVAFSRMFTGIGTLFYLCANVGAWVSPLMDRLVSTKVTFWQTLRDEMPHGPTSSLYAIELPCQRYSLGKSILSGPL